MPVCVHTYRWVSMCTQRPKEDISLLYGPPTLIPWGRTFHKIWSSPFSGPDRVVASQPQWCFCLFPSTGVTGTCDNAQIFMWVLEIRSFCLHSQCSSPRYHLRRSQCFLKHPPLTQLAGRALVLQASVRILTGATRQALSIRSALPSSLLTHRISSTSSPDC